MGERSMRRHEALLTVINLYIIVFTVPFFYSPLTMRDSASIVRQISLGCSEGGKTFEFDEQHDRTKPIRTWFQESTDGLVLFIVFYSQACRWSRCLGCNLPSTCSQFPVNYRDILKQIDAVIADPEVQEKRWNVRKLIVSNNGSILDQTTFSSTALIYLVLQANLHFPNLSVFSIETRVEYVEVEELEFLARAIGEGDSPTELELAVGFEAFDDRIRNDVMKKGLSKRVFETFVEKVARYRFRLKCYLMQKPVPGMTDEEGVRDIHDAIDYLSTLSKTCTAADEPPVRIGIHVNPTYAAKGTLLEKALRNGTYAPPNLHDVARAVLYAEGSPLSVFIGLSDEDLAIPNGSFIRAGDEEILKELEAFNRTQNYNLLRAITT